MILLIIAIFLIPVNIQTKNIIWMGALFLFSLSIVYLSGIRMGKVLQGLKAIVFLMTFTFIIQLFTIQPAGETPLIVIPMALSLVSITLLVIITFFYHYLKPNIPWRTTWFFLYVFVIFLVQWLVRDFIPNYNIVFSL